MFKKLIKKFFGDRHDRDLKSTQPIVDNINKIYKTLEPLSDVEIRNRVNEIKEDIHSHLHTHFEEWEKFKEEFSIEVDEKKKDKLSNLIDEKHKTLKSETQKILGNYLEEVFAIVKDTCRRLVGYEYSYRDNKESWFMIPFDVQLFGGIMLHQGKIAEMATGEGKTLVATLPLFLNTLVGRGVHLITVNDYLAQRDSEWMAPIFEFHGLTIGCIVGGLTNEERREAYNCDVTYGTNSEFGFDYLRENMAVSPNQLVQRDLYYAIIDEVDSVLIDEARTPLIISGQVAESKNFYKDLLPHIRKLVATQTMMVNRIVVEIKELIKKEDFDADEVGKKLLMVKRATPKHKQFLKLMKEGNLKKLLLDVEGNYIRDKKMHELDNELFYVIDEKANSVDLAEKGRNELSKFDYDLFILEQLDDLLAVIDKNELFSNEEKMKEKEKITQNFFDKNEKLHNISQLLKSFSLFEKDVDYVVQDNKVMIVDEFTGRMMPGRRFSDGLHQALEAKEHVKIEGASQTLATITLQNFFKMYDKLAGMTGTAITEEGEFVEIYNLPVSVIPTNVPISRNDYDDVIYLTKNEKYKAIIDEVEYWYKLKKPVLIGTVTVDVSETLSRMMKRRNIPHNVLNAKQHEKEADIVKNAGQAGSITIATNMAGRGTDIKLGDTVVTQSQEKYLNLKMDITEDHPYGQPLDGLHVIGTERHESRRIDRQLRGRSGRQGDPGTSRFYLSLEDDLMRLFGSDRIAPMMIKLGIKDGEAITHPWMTSAVGKAQTKVEGHNFQIRKQLIKYDEVMNQQREVIYHYRRNVLKGYDIKEEILDMIRDTIANIVELHVDSSQYFEDWNLDKVFHWFAVNFNLTLTKEMVMGNSDRPDDFIPNLENVILKEYDKREEMLSSEQMREIERKSLLQVVDTEWRDHLREMDLLRDGISLRAYANKDPLIEYKKESYELFENLIIKIFEDVSKAVFTTFIVTRAQLESMVQKANLNHDSISAFGTSNPNPTPQPIQQTNRGVEPVKRKIVPPKNS